MASNWGMTPRQSILFECGRRSRVTDACGNETTNIHTHLLCCAVAIGRCFLRSWDVYRAGCVVFVALATVKEALMAADAIEDDLARRFRIDRPPTLLSRASSKTRVGFSRMRSSRPMLGHSIAKKPEEAFAFWVPLSVPFFQNYGRQDGAE